MSLLLLDSFISGTGASVAADITADFAAAATVAERMVLTIAAGIGDELTAAAHVLGGAEFIPPEPNCPRVAVVTHFD